MSENEQGSQAKSSESTAAAFAAIDANKDGVVDTNEFSAGVSDGTVSVDSSTGTPVVDGSADASAPAAEGESAATGDVSVQTVIDAGTSTEVAPETVDQANAALEPGGDPIVLSNETVVAISVMIQSPAVDPSTTGGDQILDVALASGAGDNDAASDIVMNVLGTITAAAAVVDPAAVTAVTAAATAIVAAPADIVVSFDALSQQVVAAVAATPAITDPATAKTATAAVVDILIAAQSEATGQVGVSMVLADAVASAVTNSETTYSDVIAAGLAATDASTVQESEQSNEAPQGDASTAAPAEQAPVDSAPSVDLAAQVQPTVDAGATQEQPAVDSGAADEPAPAGPAGDEAAPAAESAPTAGGVEDAASPAVTSDGVKDPVAGDAEPEQAAPTGDAQSNASASAEAAAASADAAIDSAEAANTAALEAATATPAAGIPSTALVEGAHPAVIATISPVFAQLSPVSQMPLIQLMEYTARMRRDRMTTIEDQIRAQVGLYRLLVNAINAETDDFRLLWGTVLAVFHSAREETDPFHTTNMFQHTEHVTLHPDERKAFVNLLNIIQVTRDPAGRKHGLRQLDFAKSTQYGLTDHGRNRLAEFYGK